MRILNLSYENGPNLPEHEMLHLSVKDLSGDSITGWTRLAGIVRNFGPDLIIEREYNDGKAFYDRLYNYLTGVPRVWWWIDAHVQYDNRKRYAKNFDHLCLAVSSFVDRAHKEIGPATSWLPLCFPLESNSIVPAGDKDLEAVFIARIEPRQYFPRRHTLISAMNYALGSRFYHECNYNDMLSLVRRAKVGLNSAIQGDLNFRVWEVLGCGTELVTDSVPDLWNVHGLERHCHVYQSMDHAVEITEKLLNGDLAKKNTPATQQWIAESHCLEHRYRQLIEQVTK